MNDKQPSLLPLRLFDRDADFRIVQRGLPHWSQAGTIAFLTFRTHDSMPKEVLNRWFQDRRRWLRSHGIDPDEAQWRNRVDQLEESQAREFLETFWNRWHDSLDEGKGSCVLRRPDLADIVAKSLKHFDGERYRLLDFVVMPNHVHLLAAFADEMAMLKQCESWKHYTATQINRCLNQKCRFWQQDGFDHLVRSEAQFNYLRHYIADNPRKAFLLPGEFLHYSCP
jgi:putative transposase